MNGDVAVIGAGLAGCAVARELSRKGACVTLFDRRTQIAMEASGNPQGLFMPYLNELNTPATRIYSAGFQVTQRVLKELDGVSQGWARQTGAIQLPRHRRVQRIFDSGAEISGLEGQIERCDSAQLSELAGVRLGQSGFWLPHSLCIQMPQLCRLLIAQGVQWSGDKQLVELDWQGTWQLAFADGTQASADTVVLACSHTSAQFTQTTWLPSRKIRGQIVLLEQANGPALKTAVVRDGYITPAHQGFLVAGATFDHGREDQELDVEANRQLLQRIGQWLPDINGLPEDLKRGRVGFRHNTPDRLPLVGQIPDFATLRDQGEGAIRRFDRESAPRLPGLYITAAHASRGTLTCLLAARLLAAQICAEPVDAELTDTLDPVRFLRRALINHAVQGCAQQVKS